MNLSDIFFWAFCSWKMIKLIIRNRYRSFNCSLGWSSSFLTSYLRYQRSLFNFWFSDLSLSSTGASNFVIKFFLLSFLISSLKITDYIFKSNDHKWSYNWFLNWCWFEFFDFVLHASKSFFKFISTVLNWFNVNIVFNWCFIITFFNGCWNNVFFINWTFIELFDFKFNVSFVFFFCFCKIIKKIIWNGNWCWCCMIFIFKWY